jgi:hypothetical protein
MHLAKLREDRFVGISSTTGSTGTWTTSDIELPRDPKRLIVNAVVRGSLRVEVIDASTREPLAGYELPHAKSIALGDYLDAQVQWNDADNLSGLARRTLALRFVIDDATIFSFRFESVP